MIKKIDEKKQYFSNYNSDNLVKTIKSMSIKLIDSINSGNSEEIYDQVNKFNNILEWSIKYANELDSSDYFNDNYEYILDDILETLLDSGYDVEKVDDDIVVYTNDSYDTMHDIKDILFNNGAESDMGMFSPVRKSAWTTINIRYKRFAIDISAKDNKVVISVNESKIF